MRTFILILLFIFILPLQAQRSDFNEINFTIAENKAKLHKGEELYNLPSLVYGLTSHLKTDVEKFRAIYYWVCHNIRGNYNLMDKSERAFIKFKEEPEALDEWNKKFQKEVFIKLRNKKETLCAGYAYLIKELSNLAGIECEIVYGFGEVNKVKFDNMKIPNHSWNAVKIEGKWYLCDATWSAGFIDMANFYFEFSYDDTYFLMEPSEFVKTHRPLLKKWTLISENPEIAKQ